MSDESPITRRELDLELKNMSLEISSSLKVVLDEQFDKFQERFDDANITRRNQVIFELTGFPYEKRAKVAFALQHAYKRAVEAQDTRNKVKAAIIGVSVPAGIALAVSWLVQNFKGG